ncbi:ABC transporter permease [Acidisoma cellulosilytica]|uniref:ABC transporter permease n=1 Tax=Acidisoma cellulosilyticum TaxID=2802395 RepID=A0A963Z5Z5_9PROT|nr:ABC transporter permease [Acidisoma cellulosilyticum]MCB8883228.1 ABC transporter permease [Acidisoma cellulosilyticum]
MSGQGAAAGERWTRLGLGTLSVAIGLGVWQALGSLHLIPSGLLASPAEVWAAFIDISRHGYRGTSLGQDVIATLLRAVAGFAVGTLVGVPLGLWMGMSRLTAAAADWMVQFLRPLPPLSFLVLLSLWLGTGDTAKIGLLALTAFPIITSATYAAVGSVSRQKIQAAQSLGASSGQIFCHVLLPAALPTISTGLRIALAAAFSTVVAAELMAGSDGLGWMIFSASQYLRNDIILLGIILLGLLGMGLNSLLLGLDRGLIHWRGRE